MLTKLSSMASLMGSHPERARVQVARSDDLIFTNVFCIEQLVLYRVGSFVPHSHVAFLTQDDVTPWNLKPET